MIWNNLFMYNRDDRLYKLFKFCILVILDKGTGPRNVN